MVSPCHNQVNRQPDSITLVNHGVSTCSYLYWFLQSLSFAIPSSEMTALYVVFHLPTVGRWVGGYERCSSLTYVFNPFPLPLTLI